MLRLHQKSNSRQCREFRYSWDLSETRHIHDINFSTLGRHLETMFLRIFSQITLQLNYGFYRLSSQGLNQPTFILTTIQDKVLIPSTVQTINLTSSRKSICFYSKMKLVRSSTQNHTSMSQAFGQPGPMLLTFPIICRLSS